MADSSDHLWLFTLVLVTIISIHQGNAAPRSVDSNSNIETRIVWGIEVPIEDFPYQVAVLTKTIDRMGLCGGSIIKEYYVLTAAHCVDGTEPVAVISGTNKIGAGGERREVTKVTKHPKYDKPSQYNDIAILEVEKPFDFGTSTTKPIELYDKSGMNISKHVGRQVKIPGFGATSYNGTTDKKLRYAYGDIIGSKECNKMWVKPMSEKCFCAIDKAFKQNPCNGDSGGPLVMDEHLLGIVSQSEKCGSTGYPTVYTNVVHYAQWIEENTKRS